MAFSIYLQHLIGISCVSSLTFIAIHVCLFPTLLKLSCFKDDYIMFYKGCFGPYWIIIPNVFPLWSHCSILVWLFMLDSICFLSIHLTWSLCLDQIAIFVSKFQLQYLYGETLIPKIKWWSMSGNMTHDL